MGDIQLIHVINLGGFGVISYLLIHVVLLDMRRIHERMEGMLEELRRIRYISEDRQMSEHISPLNNRSGEKLTK